MEAQPSCRGASTPRPCCKKTTMRKVAVAGAVLALVGSVAWQKRELWLSPSPSKLMVGPKRVTRCVRAGRAHGSCSGGLWRDQRVLPLHPRSDSELRRRRLTARAGRRDHQEVCGQALLGRCVLTLDGWHRMSCLSIWTCRCSPCSTGTEVCGWGVFFVAAASCSAPPGGGVSHCAAKYFRNHFTNALKQHPTDMGRVWLDTYRLTEESYRLGARHRAAHTHAADAKGARTGARAPRSARCPTTHHRAARAPPLLPPTLTCCTSGSASLTQVPRWRQLLHTPHRHNRGLEVWCAAMGEPRSQLAPQMRAVPA